MSKRSQIKPPSRPKRSLLLLETRAAVDFARMLGPLASASFRPKPVDPSRLVIVVPGFGSGDSYTLPLRRYLRNQGLEAEGWGLGTNLAGTDLPHELSDLSERWDVAPKDEYRGEAAVPFLIDRLYERVAERHAATGKTISLVGWSLGGYFAREVARDMPQIVDRVITMGSPVSGGPKYTAAAGFFEARGQDLDWIEEEVTRRAVRPIQQPITAIVSKTDGIVGWEAAQDAMNPNVRHVNIDAAHLGMGFKPEIWSYVLEALLEKNHKLQTLSERCAA
ncbi:MAG: alpha/beta hydrolase [Congregibacter sp.]